MRVLAMEIYGFRGIGEAKLLFPPQVALVGPTGSGKSSLVDALSLVLGRQRLVRDLTEHDFTGSTPAPQDRIRIVATLGVCAAGRIGHCGESRRAVQASG